MKFLTIQIFFFTIALISLVLGTYMAFNGAALQECFIVILIGITLMSLVFFNWKGKVEEKG